MKILHLYDDLMNLYGEYGNVVVLKKHLEDQGIKVTLVRKTIGDKFNFNDYDFIYCGSGTEKNQLIALNDLLLRKDNLKEAINDGKVLLFTGNAMELLGKKIDNHKALNLIKIETTSSTNRYTGDVIMNSEFGEVVGFINKCTMITPYTKPLFKYIFKDSNLKDEETEGYHYKNVFGTHVIGPVLVKNPGFMKEIVTLLGKNNNKKFTYKDIDYPFEVDSYNVTLNALKGRMK